MAARVAVEGVEVLDDLAEPQGRQQIHEQDVQGQERGGVRKRKAESVLRPLERVCRGEDQHLWACSLHEVASFFSNLISDMQVGMGLSPALCRVYNPFTRHAAA